MSHMLPGYNISHAIKQEIQRFESVHPSIYAIYDLIESIEDRELQDTIRDHVVCIEDSFVNSEEWTLSRCVPELKLGVVGSVHSGKSALVHRYLTGSYMQDESPEGGRFKKEVLTDGCSNLLLIRDEGRPPDSQFTAWCDACIFVFALDNVESFETVYQYYGKMSQCRNLSEIPLLLVGTQDSISESRPRVIDEGRTRKCAQDLRRCAYFETCATYGHNVDRVFQDACHKISSSLRLRPPTPQQPLPGLRSAPGMYNAVQTGKEPQGKDSRGQLAASGRFNPPTHAASPTQQQHLIDQVEPIACSQYYEPPHLLPLSYQPPTPPAGKPVKKSDSLLREKVDDHLTGCQQEYSATYYASAPVTALATAAQQLGQRQARDRTSYAQGEKSDKEAGSTPSATPTQNRKNKRRSNLFNRKDDEARKLSGGQSGGSVPATVAMASAGQTGGGAVGSGRAIPVKQGNLYKKSVNALNREWKKKYVTLTEDGKLTYHPNLHDYMENSHGKDIDLSRTTVKIPGQLRPTSNGLLKSQQQQQQQQQQGNGEARQEQQADKKRRHRRAKSGTRGADSNNVEESDGYEFMIVSLENRTWHFEAPSQEERDEWVRAIEHSIMRCLQAANGAHAAAAAATHSAAIRSVFGNTECADCGKQAPDWASLNLGSLVCIECSGVHRQLGTHLSRVRSLSLDDWPPNHVLVMRAIGNKLANSVWEARLSSHATFRKPSSDASREEKEIFIRAKYERRQFLPDLPFRDSPVQQQLIDAIARSDTRQVILCLAVAGSAVNEPYSKQDPRAAIHIAATLGQLVYLQLLLWYNADPGVCDAEGRNAHFYASAANKPDCAEFLRQSGCPPATSHAATLPRRRSRTTPNAQAPTQPTAEIGL